VFVFVFVFVRVRVRVRVFHEQPAQHLPRCRFGP
jgi:hypothetical protein